MRLEPPLVENSGISHSVRMSGKIERVQQGKDSDMPIVNNVTRLLDSRKIPYAAFETPTEKLGALDVANLLGIEADTVFKTIVVTCNKPKKPLLVIVPGSSQVDLKMLASEIGEKKVYLPTEHEAEQLTGLQAGGISPLALINKGFRVIVDSSAQAYSEIHISGGERGLNIRLAVNDLVKLTNAGFALVSKPKEKI